MMKWSVLQEVGLYQQGFRYMMQSQMALEVEMDKSTVTVQDSRLLGDG